MSVLSLGHLSKQYPRGHHPAVDDLSFEVQSSEVFALLGESGSGKTTTLRLIAGFEIPSAGVIRILSRTVAGPSHFVPPEKRGVRMVFQQSALFPHLTVADNLAFAVPHLTRSQRTERSRQVLATVDLERYAARYPHELSGGQRQRVELARALISEPALLLLDEPFSNLDVSLRAQLRDEVAEILRRSRTTTILVTHDVEDAFTVSDRVAVLKKGKLQQVGTPREVYRQPANRYVARFFGGINLLEGQCRNQSVVTAFGAVELEAGSRTRGQSVVVSIRPEGFEIVAEEFACLKGRVQQTTFLGRFQEVRLLPESSEANGNTRPLIVHLPAEVKIETAAVLALRPKAGSVQIVPWSIR